MSLASNNDSAQKLGICRVLYAPSSTGGAPLHKITSCMRRLQEVTIVCVPTRITSYHFCFEDTRINGLLSLFRMIAGKDLRLRMKTHCGRYPAIRLSTTGRRARAIVIAQLLLFVGVILSGRNNLTF